MTEEDKAIQALEAAHDHRDSATQVERLISDVRTKVSDLTADYALLDDDADLVRVLRGHSRLLVRKLHQLERGFREKAGRARSEGRHAVWMVEQRREAEAAKSPGLRPLRQAAN
jgi:hypothetical protein